MGCLLLGSVMGEHTFPSLFPPLKLLRVWAKGAKSGLLAEWSESSRVRCHRRTLEALEKEVQSRDQGLQANPPPPKLASTVHFSATQTSHVLATGLRSEESQRGQQGSTAALQISHPIFILPVCGMDSRMRLAEANKVDSLLAQSASLDQSLLVNMIVKRFIGVLFHVT